MQMRSYFDARLEEVCNDVVDMGHMVSSLLTQALDVLRSLDASQVEAVVDADEEINEKRFALEKKCTALIATQQPAARDVRKLIAVVNLIVDLERMGDQAKGIAKAVPHMVQYPDVPYPVQLNNMAYVAHQMLQDSMTAFCSLNVELANTVARMDDEMDRLYGSVFYDIIDLLADDRDPYRIEATYEILRVARNLERFGDLATNIVERVHYMVTGQLNELNSEQVAELEPVKAFAV
jgi:phosphate transport system protein